MPFIPHTEEDVKSMLAAIGVDSIENLFDEIPAELRAEGLTKVPEGASEMEVSRIMHELAEKDSRALCFGSINLLELGQTEKGLQWLRRAEESDPDDALNMYNVACAYAYTSEIEKAIDCLEQSINKGMAQMDWITHDTDLDNLRDHPRFKALLPDG